MSKNPLAEVFGFPVDDFSERAERYRKNRLCPFHNRVANCTKDKASDPLGVCSIKDNNGAAVITCPVRFRQDWLIAEDAASFFFPAGVKWTTLAEVCLNDADGKSAGNIDHVLVSYDERGRLLDFGALEVQAVYISGNIRRVFEVYLEDPINRHTMDWRGQRNYPRPDYLSSSRKRLAPQLIYKGGILNAWGKKQAVALNRSFFDSLPELPEVEPKEAEIAWLIYDLVRDDQQYQLQRHTTRYTRFEAAMNRIATPRPGNMDTFFAQLQTRLDARLERSADPPETASLTDLL